MCSSTLLLLHVTTLYAATVGSGIDLYSVAIAREAGATYDIAAAIFVPLGFITAVCSLIAGWAADQGLAPHKVLSISTLMIALASPEAWESAATLAIEEVDACLLDYDEAGPICGKATFEDGLTCIEQITNGQTRWVCA